MKHICRNLYLILCVPRFVVLSFSYAISCLIWTTKKTIITNYLLYDIGIEITDEILLIVMIDIGLQAAGISVNGATQLMLQIDKWQERDKY